MGWTFHNSFQSISPFTVSRKLNITVDIAEDRKQWRQLIYDVQPQERETRDVKQRWWWWRGRPVGRTQYTTESRLDCILRRLKHLSYNSKHMDVFTTCNQLNLLCKKKIFTRSKKYLTLVINHPPSLKKSQASLKADKVRWALIKEKFPISN